GGGYADLPMASSWHEDSGNLPQDTEDSVSNYGALDTQDIKRLSFVSFADLVHAEHAETDQMSNRGSMYLGGLSSNTPLATQNRSPSPVRYPVSSHGFGTSPPTSVSPSSKILESSPNRGGRGPASPVLYNTYSPPLRSFGSELN